MRLAGSPWLPLEVGPIGCRRDGRGLVGAPSARTARLPGPTPRSTPPARPAPRVQLSPTSQWRGDPSRDGPVTIRCSEAGQMGRPAVESYRSGAGLPVAPRRPLKQLSQPCEAGAVVSGPCSADPVPTDSRRGHRKPEPLRNAVVAAGDHPLRSRSSGEYRQEGPVAAGDRLAVPAQDSGRGAGRGGPAQARAGRGSSPLNAGIVRCLWRPETPDPGARPVAGLILAWPPSGCGDRHRPRTADDGAARRRGPPWLPAAGV
jgi:hypothetical protein